MSDDAPVSGGGPGTNDYTYDANANRLTGEGSTYTISSTSNRILSVSGALSRTYSYDSSGNTTGDGSATFTYNDAGRMANATKAGVTTSYALNGLGQRVKKTKAGTSTYFMYDEAGHLVGEYDNAGSLIQETIWFGDTPVAVLKPNGSGGVNLFYIHTDHLNTPRRISRPSDNVVIWRWDSDPFGATVANEDPDGDTQLFSFNLRFPGTYADSETGLLYNWHRDLDPQTGRYTQSDPIGLDPRVASHNFVTGCLTSDVTGGGSVSRVLRVFYKPGNEAQSDGEGGQKPGLHMPWSSRCRSGANVLGVVLHLADQPLNGFAAPVLQATPQRTQMAGAIKSRIARLEFGEEFYSR